MPSVMDDMAGLPPIKNPPAVASSASLTPRPEGFVVNNGWIKIHRKILDWEWYEDDNVFRLFIHLLLTVNHEHKRWRGIDIKPGQIITGRHTLAEHIGLSEQSVRTALNKLKSTNEITIESSKQYSIITINKWKDYQDKTGKSTNEQPTSNQRATTTKEVKNDKKVRSKEITSTAQGAGNEVNLLIGLFKPLNPSIERMFGRPPQRAAAERLLKLHGAEKIQKALLFVEKCRADRFCPTITTPIQLEEKWGALEAFAAKKRVEINKNKIVSV